MKTIKIDNDNVTLDEFKNKWGWTIGQFRRLATYKDFDTYKQNMDNLETIANNMIENAFNECYKAQNKEGVNNA